MHGLEVLSDLVVIFAAAVLVVALLRRIQIPSVAGFIVAGVLAGPNALGLARDAGQIEILAEIGVVLLLFGIGLELSFDRVRHLWRPALLGGTLQVALTGAATVALALLFGAPPAVAVFLGFLVAPSSTAIVLRGLSDRGEIDAPFGRLTVGILIFQDLCVVPMMLAIPLLAGAGGSLGAAAGSFAAALIGIAVMLLLGRFLVPKVLGLAARTRQRDLFLLTLLLVCLGTAWGATLGGLSLALGAFLAGLVVAGSEYRHQALSDLIPFREVFASLFFVSVGMLLDPLRIVESPGRIVLLLVALVLGKLVLVAVTGLLLRLPLRVALLAGISLAQVGEFAFVLARAAQGTDLILEPFAADFFAASALSMLLTPIAMTSGRKVVAGAARIRWLTRLLEVPPAVEAAGEARCEDHVIIAGYGVAGEALSGVLRERGVSYVVVDLNPRNVERARKKGEPAFFGDVTSPEILEAVGIEHARELVFLINEPAAVEAAIRVARALAPDVHIVVRSRYVGDIAPLKRAGADRVVPAELEAAVAVVSHLLERHGADRATIDTTLTRLRP